jgi:hypothetical protein
VAPVERLGTEDEFYTELERLAAAFSAACDGLDTGDVVSYVVEIIRDLAWAVDELIGSDEASRMLIEQGNVRTWSIESDDAP